MKLVVIGYGPGGIAAATSAKTFNRDVDVVIYTNEEMDAHRKPGASLALEYPDTRDLVIPDWSFKTLREKGIKVQSDVRVVDIDTTSKVLKIEKGAAITEESYDKLVLAPGASPIILRG